ncbi:MAG TPA: MFS transporter [Candidatus Limnocylindrales bacterium]|jgi:MFS family permease|nr:MFS transporter [Candidatus Limnocylindrales bacterium]
MTAWEESRRRRGERAFRALWVGQSVSQLGSQISLVVLPLIAAVTLRASPFEVGLLAALETAPYLFASLPAGMLADRMERRRLLVLTDIGRACCLMVVPLAYFAGVLSVPVLLVVALVSGTMSVVFDVAYHSYVPLLVPAGELVEANRRLELSSAGAAVAGPPLAGVVMARIGGPFAVLIDVASYLVSAAAVLRSPRFRRPMARPAEAAGMFERMLSGMRHVRGDRVMRDLALSTATFNLASSSIFAVLVVFATRDVGLGPAGFGLLFGLGNVGFLVGAAIVGRLTARVGSGQALFLGSWLGALAMILLPMASGPLAAGALFLGRFTGATAAAIFNVNAYAVRQARVPDSILGRVNASFRLLDWGTLPIGALLGGFIGSVAGVRWALLVAAVLGLGSMLWLVRSPVRRLGARGVEAPIAGGLVSGSPAVD